MRIRRTPLSSADILKGVAKLHTKDIDLGLDRFRALLHRLGNPQDNLPPVIHVAGTNGKGSTIAFFRAFFEASGYRVHSFTSPHFLRPHETINLAGDEIGEELLADLLQEVVDANADAALTVFEAISAAAFLAFARTNGHILLLETGMGGAGDTTNVVKNPVLCAITPVSMDHKEFLGKSLAKIATHKAGIIKKGVPCVVAKQNDKAYQPIRDYAKKMSAPIYREGHEWFVKKAGTRMVFEGWQGDRAWPRPNLYGEHQLQNAGVALAGVEILKERFHLPEEALCNAIQSVEWPGRLERVAPAPWLDERWEIWLDGGHNTGAAKVLRTQLNKWDDRPTYLVFGMLKRKNSKAFLKYLIPCTDHVYTVGIPNQPAKAPEVLATTVHQLGGYATACHDLALALSLIRAENKTPGRILICGSLTLLAEFYALQSRP